MTGEEAQEEQEPEEEEQEMNQHQEQHLDEEQQGENAKAAGGETAKGFVRYELRGTGHLHRTRSSKNAEQVVKQHAVDENEHDITHSATLTKTPLGVGWTLDAENVITEIKLDSQVARFTSINTGDQVRSINGMPPNDAVDLPPGTIMEVLLVSADARLKKPAPRPGVPRLKLPVVGAGRGREDRTASTSNPTTPRTPPAAKSRLSRKDSTAPGSSSMPLGDMCTSGQDTARERARGERANPIRRMRLREQNELTQGMIDGIVVYLSPFYRLLPGSGVNIDGDLRHNMYNELRTRLTDLGIKMSSNPNEMFGPNQRVLMLLVLCPGFFACADLVEEAGRALRKLRSLHSGTHKNACIASNNDLLSGMGAAGTSGAESTAGSPGLLVRTVSRFMNKVTVLPFASTSMPFDEYVRTCPPDLKELDLFELAFHKWPESGTLQPTAIKTAICKLPDHHYVSRAERTTDLLLRLSGRTARTHGKGHTRKAARQSEPRYALDRGLVSPRRDSAADQSGLALARGECGVVSPRRSDRKSSVDGSQRHLRSPRSQSGTAAAFVPAVSRDKTESTTDVQRYERERAAYRAVRAAQSNRVGDVAHTALMLKRLPSCKRVSSVSESASTDQHGELQPPDGAEGSAQKGEGSVQQDCPEERRLEPTTTTSTTTITTTITTSTTTTTTTTSSSAAFSPVSLSSSGGGSV